MTVVGEDSGSAWGFIRAVAKILLMWALLLRSLGYLCPDGGVTDMCGGLPEICINYKSLTVKTKGAYVYVE